MGVWGRDVGRGGASEGYEGSSSSSSVWGKVFSLSFSWTWVIVHKMHLAFPRPIMRGA